MSTTPLLATLAVGPHVHVRLVRRLEEDEYVHSDEAPSTTAAQAVEPAERADTVAVAQFLERLASSGTPQIVYITKLTQTTFLGAGCSFLEWHWVQSCGSYFWSVAD